MKYRYTEVQKAWLEDLETTHTKQVGGALIKLSEKSNRPAGYCCLGRACVVMKVPRTGELFRNSEGKSFAGYLAPSVLERLGLTQEGHDRCAEMNDSGKSFKEIADAIKAKPAFYFGKQPAVAPSGARFAKRSKR